MDASSLSHMTQEEFETNVATAIQSFPRDPDDPTHRLPPSPSTGFSPVPPPPIATDLKPGVDDSESPSLIQRPELSFPNATKAIFRSTERLVSKPLGAIGRIFDQLESLADGHDNSPSHIDTSADSYRSPVGRPASVRSNRSGYRQYTLQSSQGPPHPPLVQGETSAAAYPSSPRYVPISQTFPQSPAGPAASSPNDYSGPRRRTNSGLNVEEVTLEIDRQHEQQRLASIGVRSIMVSLCRATADVITNRHSRAFSRSWKRKSWRW